MRRQLRYLPTWLMPICLLVPWTLAVPAHADETTSETATPEPDAPKAEPSETGASETRSPKPAAGAEAADASTASDDSGPPPMSRPYLWVLECQPRVFFCGTIHLNDPRVLAQPASVKAALDASDVVLTEIDLRKPDLTSASRIMRLPEGHLLSRMLPKKLYDRTAAVLAKSGVDIQTLEYTKIWAVTFRLQFAKPGASESAKPGTASMDAALSQQAADAGKDVSGIESILEQLRVFDNLDLNEQIRMLESAVSAVENAEQGKPSSLTELVDVYLQGDEQALYRFLCADVDPHDRGPCCFMRKILDCRNERIVNRVLERRRSDAGKTLFVAVGAGHYPGPRGILTLLRRRGFSVRRVESVAELAVTTSTTAPAVFTSPPRTQQPAVVSEPPRVYYYYPQRRRARRPAFRFPFFSSPRCR